MEYNSKSTRGSNSRKNNFSKNRSSSNDRSNSNFSNRRNSSSKGNSRNNSNRGSEHNTSVYRSDFLSTPASLDRNSNRSNSNRNSSFSRSSSSHSSNSTNSGNRRRPSFSNRGGGYGNQSRSRNRSNNRSGNRNRFSQKIDPQLYISTAKTSTEQEPKKYEGKKYSEFKLNEQLAKNLTGKGFETATEIQDKAIPLITKGNDVLGISATGSGKTGAFLIPMVEKLINNKNQKLLVLAPTRELALQIAKEAVTLIWGTNLHVSLIVGGESMGKQIQQLKRGSQIVVGTPGRLNDLIKRSIIKPHEFNNIVVDEVDRMFDMGFIDDIKFIFNLVSKERQSLFFSATLNNTVEKIVQSLSDSYDVIKLANNTPSTSVVQSVIDYSHSDEKIQKLEEILKKDEVAKAIVFVDTKRFADQIDEILQRKNFKVGVIHGDKRQNMRKRVIGLFKESRINILVATNVAARGIDIDDITHVINLDEPQTYDEYIHRIGRTGRNGATGVAYTFVRR